MIKTDTLSPLLDTIKTLRGDKGCPWDKKQTQKTLSKYLKSECEELVTAIDNDDVENICEELGDLLYVLLMIAEINTESDNFSLKDVVAGITNKLIRRHPHVFEGTPYKDEADLNRQWQKIKALEKRSNSV